MAATWAEIFAIARDQQYAIGGDADFALDIGEIGPGAGAKFAGHRRQCQRVGVDLAAQLVVAAVNERAIGGKIAHRKHEIRQSHL